MSHCVVVLQSASMQNCMRQSEPHPSPSKENTISYHIAPWPYSTCSTLRFLPSLPPPSFFFLHLLSNTKHPTTRRLNADVQIKWDVLDLLHSQNAATPEDVTQFLVGLAQSESTSADDLDVFVYLTQRSLLTGTAMPPPPPLPILSLLFSSLLFSSFFSPSAYVLERTCTCCY